jgi:hypothetical protein
LRQAIKSELHNRKNPLAAAGTQTLEIDVTVTALLVGMPAVTVNGPNDCPVVTVIV